MVKKDYEREQDYTEATWMDQLPEDSITILIKANGKMFARGVKLDDSVMATKETVMSVCQMAIDSVDQIGLRAGMKETDATAEA